MEETRACAVCGTTTVHYDGACEQCLIRKDSSTAVPVQHAVIAQPQERPRRNLKFKIAMVMSIAILVVVAGFMHIVHGGGVGLKICPKEDWSLTDTFVDLDDIVGRPRFMLLDKAKVTRALAGCGIIGEVRTGVSQECLDDPVNCHR